jgi:hypothetical protein
MEMGHFKNIKLDQKQDGTFQNKTKFDMFGEWFGLITYKNKQGKEYKSEKQELIVN